MHARGGCVLDEADYSPPGLVGEEEEAALLGIFQRCLAEFPLGNRGSFGWVAVGSPAQNPVGRAGRRDVASVLEQEVGSLVERLVRCQGTPDLVEPRVGSKLGLRLHDQPPEPRGDADAFAGGLLCDPLGEWDGDSGLDEDLSHDV